MEGTEKICKNCMSWKGDPKERYPYFGICSGSPTVKISIGSKTHAPSQREVDVLVHQAFGCIKFKSPAVEQGNTEQQAKE
jgi:hypothetical protein